MTLADLFLIKTGKVPLTPHQERRKGMLTSSDAAILLGVHPWAYRPPADMEEDDAVQLGRLLERPILRWGARQVGERIVCNQFRVRDMPEIKVGAQHDALSLSDKAHGFEVKTSGLRGPTAFREEWGEPGTDQVPAHVLAQVHWQMLVSELDVVWVPVLLGGRGHLLYRVVRSEDLIEVLVSRAVCFWRDHVLTNTPPEGEIPSLDLARIIRRQEKKVIALPGWKAVIDWRITEEQAKAWKEKADEAKAAMLVEMGDAEIAETDDGSVVVQKVESNRLDTKALKKEHPELAEKYSKTSESVRITWKRTKQTEQGVAQ